MGELTLWGKFNYCSKAERFCTAIPQASINLRITKIGVHTTKESADDGEVATEVKPRVRRHSARHHAFSWSVLACSASAGGSMLSRRGSKPRNANARRIAITPKTMPTKRLQMTSSSVTGCAF
jgi:hypothetical protein